MIVVQETVIIKIRSIKNQHFIGKVLVSLVLHGGSGTGEENLRKACQLGIAKVNIANDVLRAAQDALEKEGMEGNNIYGFFDVIREGYYKKSRELMQLFGCSEKA